MKTDKVVSIFQKLFLHEVVVSVDKKRGNEHDVVEINDRWICKSAKTKGMQDVIAREVALLRSLEGKITTAIPKVLYFEQGVLIYEKIAGIPLSLEFCWNLQDDQHDQLAQEIALFLYQMHRALPMKDIENLGYSVTDWPWSLEKLQQAGKLYIDESLQQSFDYFTNNYMRSFYPFGINSVQSKLAQASIRHVLLHNDMSFQNIIVDPLTGQLQGIVDFSDVALGDFHLDLRGRGVHDPALLSKVADAYAKLLHKPIHEDKINVYRLATDFSKYFQAHQEGKMKVARDMKMRLKMIVLFDLMMEQDAKK